MIKKNLLILSILTIFTIKIAHATPAVPKKVQKKLETAIENSGFKKLLKTREELASGNDQALLGRAQKFSGANKVSAEQKNQQAEALGSILTSLNESSAAQEGIRENCDTIFDGTEKYDQNQVLKIISRKIDIKGLQSLCPAQVNTLLAATKK